MPKIIIFIFLWFFCGEASAAPSPSIPHNGGTADVTILPENADKIPLEKGISYFFETTPITHTQAAALSPDQWTVLADGKIPYFDTRAETIWMRFTIRNMANDDSAWLMEVFWTFLNNVDVFQYNPDSDTWNTPMTNGLNVSIEERTLPHRLVLFPMNLPRGQTTHIYIRSWSNSKLFLPIAFHKHKFFEQYDSTYTLIFGIYFGILLIMLCYNFSLFFFTEDRSYLIYATYVFSIILYSLMSTGFGPLYFWDRSLWLKTHGYVILSSFAFLTATLFVRQFLSLKEYGGWIYHTNTVFIVYWSVSMMLYAIRPHQAWVKLEDLVGILSNILGLVTAVYLWAKGNVSARYFTIAWSFVIFGTFIVMLALVGAIELNQKTMFSQMIGFVIEAILLSLALAERFNREKSAREEAHQMALDLSHKINSERKSKLKAQKRLLKMQRRTSEELELQVRERTLELEQATLRLEEANNELSDLSITDPLTKIHNRHYFDEIISTEIKRAVRTTQPLSVMMVDIDHFKAINDGHGHLVGDQCLCLVAKTIRQNVSRTSDLVARYGGEEFAIVLPATTPDNAVVLAEGIRTSVEKLIFVDQGKAVKLRVSIGVAGWVPIKEESSERLIQVADQALYRAKDNGRNRVEAAVIVGEHIENTNRSEGESISH